MASISSLGIGSGLDINSLVDQLVSAERAPTENRLGRRAQTLQTQLSGLGKLKSALGDFRGQVRELSELDAFRSMSATSSDSQAISVSAEPGADTGRFDIAVNQLAGSQGLASGAFAERTSPVGSGTLTFRFGDTSTDASGAITGFSENTQRGSADVTISEAATSLTDVRDAVNDAQIGIRASIINDGSGERLVFSSDETGADNGFLVEVNDSDGSNTDSAGLSRLAYNAAGANLEQTQQAQDAQLSVNGLGVSRASNGINDLIEGATLSLNGTTETAARIDISQDDSAARDRIKGFVEGYNGFQNTLNKLTGYDPETERAGPLAGNGLVRSIANGLRGVISQRLPELENAGVRSLADIGIATTRDGTLEINNEALNTALEDNFEAVGALFAPSALTDDAANVNYVGSQAATKGGEYGIGVTAPATPGSFTGDAIAGDFPITVDDSNDLLRFAIDGVETAPLKLTQGTYDDGAALAAEIQSRINGDGNLRDAGVSANVGFASGRLVITSASVGSESTVAITEADVGVASSLGLSAAEGTAGNDVKGTIGGTSATGDGRILTGRSGDTQGLAVEIVGDSTGSRGSVVFSQGLMGALDATISSYIDSSGTLSSSTDSLNDRLENVAEDRRDLNERMARVRERYTQQFAAMDALVAQLNQTSDYLSRQLSSLPGAGGNNQG